SFFFSSRRRHTRSKRDWSSDVCSSDLENHLQFVVLRLRDAAGDLSASRKHGLSVHLDGPGDAGRERITPVILIAGEGLADGRGDLGAFRQGDEVEWLRRIGEVASRRSEERR